MDVYYHDGSVTLHHGDSLEVMRSMADESVDITVTSPPYNMGLVPGGNGRGMYAHTTQKSRRFSEGYAGGEISDAMPHDEYLAWQRECLAEMWRISRYGVFYNHRPRVIHGNWTMPLEGDYGPDVVLGKVIIWDRGTGIDVNVRQFCTRGEWIMLFTKPDFRLIDHAASGMGDVWRLGIEYGVPDHPAPFPVTLPERCIQATGATSVLDPFCGSGSTLVAAKQCGIQGIGIELSAAYCALAVERLAQSSLFETPAQQREPVGEQFTMFDTAV